jgi:exonuclease VII large subunit
MTRIHPTRSGATPSSSTPTNDVQTPCTTIDQVNKYLGQVYIQISQASREEIDQQQQQLFEKHRKALIGQFHGNSTKQFTSSHPKVIEVHKKFNAVLEATREVFRAKFPNTDEQIVFTFALAINQQGDTALQDLLEWTSQPKPRSFINTAKFRALLQQVTESVQQTEESYQQKIESNLEQLIILLPRLEEAVLPIMYAVLNQAPQPEDWQTLLWNLGRIGAAHIVPVLESTPAKKAEEVKDLTGALAKRFKEISLTISQGTGRGF